MHEDHRSIEEIEADLERERLALQANLAALRQKMSVRGVAEEAMGLIGPAAKGVGSSVEATARSYPLATLATGAGLVWLLFGRGGRHRRATVARASSGFGANVAATASAAATVATAVAALNPDDLREMAGEVDRIYRAGAERLKALDADLRRRATAAGAELRDKAEQVGDLAAGKARVVADIAAEVKEHLERGLGALPEEAEAFFDAARDRAQKATQQAGAAGAAVYDDLALLVARHPLAAGAGAALLGALLAVALEAGQDSDAPDDRA